MVVVQALFVKNLGFYIFEQVVITHILSRMGTVHKNGAIGLGYIAMKTVIIAERVLIVIPIVKLVIIPMKDVAVQELLVPQDALYLVLEVPVILTIIWVVKK
jgi:hypothetical protein